MKKPTLPALQITPPARGWFEAVQFTLDILTGRRGKIAPIVAPPVTAAGAAPTKTEFDRLSAKHEELAARFNAYVARSDE